MDSEEIELEHEKILEEANFISKNFEDTMSMLKDIITDISLLDEDDASLILTPRTERLLDEKLMQEIQSLHVSPSKSVASSSTDKEIQSKQTVKSSTVSTTKTDPLQPKNGSTKSNESKKSTPAIGKKYSSPVNRVGVIAKPNTDAKPARSVSPTKRQENPSPSKSRPRTVSKTVIDPSSSHTSSDIPVRSSTYSPSTTNSSMGSSTFSKTTLTEVLLQKLHTLGPILTQVSSILLEKHAQLLDEQTLKLLTFFHKYENKEQNHWMQGIQQLLYHQLISPPQTDLFRQLIQPALQNHIQRCVVPSIGSVCPKIAILAAEKAGKTSILYETTVLCCEKFLTTGQWLTHLLLPINWKYFVEREMDVEQFYCKYICHVLVCLTQQRTDLLAFQHSLQQFVCTQIRQSKSGVVQKLPMEFCKRYPRQHLFLMQWVEKMKKLWEEGCYEILLEQVLHSPKRLGELFGFEKVVCIFDNFEFADVHLIQSYHHSSQRVTKPLYRILKKALETECFVVSGISLSLQTVLSKSNLLALNYDVDWFTIAEVINLETLIDPPQLQLPNETLCITTSDGTMSQEVPIHLFKGNPGFLCHLLERSNHSKSIPVTKEFITQLQQWITMQQQKLEEKKRNEEEEWEYSKQNTALLQCMVYSTRQ